MIRNASRSQEKPQGTQKEELCWEWPKRESVSIRQKKALFPFLSNEIGNVQDGSREAILRPWRHQSAQGPSQSDWQSQVCLDYPQQITTQPV
jgi:hypothetical protein